MLTGQVRRNRCHFPTEDFTRDDSSLRAAFRTTPDPSEGIGCRGGREMVKSLWKMETVKAKANKDFAWPYLTP